MMTRRYKLLAKLCVFTFAIFSAAGALAEGLPDKTLGWPGLDFQGFPCKGNPQGYGPFDYTNPYHFKKKLPIVEGAHFTKKVERLQGGESAHLYGDLDYTLRAFPNHHRALHAILRYTTGVGHEARPPLIAKPECYFQRALTFQPKDATARLLFGAFLHKKDKLELALEQYQRALSLKPGHPSIHYNLGLLYLELKQYEKAREHAKKAYAKGYRQSGLKRQLAKAGFPLK